MLLPFVIEEISDGNPTVMPNVTKGGLHCIRIRADRRNLVGTV
jgi:hypothetical protein